MPFKYFSLTIAIYLNFNKSLIDHLNKINKRFLTIACSIFVLIIIGFFSIPQSSYAQTNPSIKRVTVSQRGDGRGYVIRFEMTAPADSFLVIQPSNNLVQLIIYKKDLTANKVHVLNRHKQIQDIKIHKIPQGAGVNIQLQQKHYMIATAYPDVNKKDLLVALTVASKKDIETLTQGISRINWNQFNTPKPQNVKVNLKTVPPPGSSGLKEDASYYNMKKKIKFNVVVLDPGHGGKDPGTIGWHHVEEKNIALAVALKVGHYIKKYMPGVKVVYTRHTDKFIPLKERGHIANKAQGDLFISIHCNSSPDKHVHGVTTYFLGLHHTKQAYEVTKRENSVVKLENNGSNKKSKLSEEQILLYELANSGYMANSQKFAEDLNYQFKYRAHRYSRGIRQAGFIVLYYASMPAVLIELGFLSNKREERFLDSKHGQDIMASAIFRAIRKYKQQVDKSQNISSK